ncbi:alpha-1,4-glucan--maltose-1-phosphate maltosyltransferase, partial [Parvibaculum sp.]|uniref:alpha-1,4-glucan--maltose-1-phosphate maltosyltransferase n=1 Tax=Parvibaculum sp. TaxID=2024848 RepID=UPI002CF11B46
ACGHGALISLPGGGADASALVRTNLASPACSDDAFLLLANASLHRSTDIDTAQVLTHTGLFTHFDSVNAGAPEALDPSRRIRLKPGEVLVFKGSRPHPVIVETSGKQAILEAMHAPRIAIENVTPSVDEGRFPVKRIVGERVIVEADIFADGHDELAVELLWRPADQAEWNRIRMTATENDRWRAELPLERLGAHLFTIEAWWDDFRTLKVHLKKKLAAGVSLHNEIEDGRAQLVAAIPHAEGEPRDALESALAGLDAAADDTAKAGLLLSDALSAAMDAVQPRRFPSRHPSSFPIWAERLEARFASWYELFPRSQSGDPQRHGTFDDVIARLPAIRDMGFDVLYMPPIHPIGRTNRKGRNNALTTEPGDPGSPYAIGGVEGGHTDIHPELGTLADFRRLRDAARDQGLELALDFAIQCSPDHPWIREHPDWFRWQPDGTLRYAENPPKKYEDITNVEFYAEGAIPDLWLALESVVLFWVVEGVKIFRVDNPHTKPYPFWEWLIASVRARHPDVIFLSEAFTAPKRMNRLAKLGFSQSYTYFTWRHTKEELTDYLTELNGEGVRDYFRPNFFVNTPDINPPFLQTAGRPGHLIRAALATLLSGLWGVYSGFELCEATPLPGREEYLNSEKYEIRAWDWARPGNIVAEISQLNRIRKANPALHTHLGLKFYNAFNDQILYFAKATPGRDNVVLAAINLDPFRAHEAAIELPLWEWGFADHAALQAHDLMRGHSFVWHGKNQTVRLDPAELPFAIWRVRPYEEF